MTSNAMFPAMVESAPMRERKIFNLTALSAEFTIGEGELMASAMSLWDALRDEYDDPTQELVRTFLSVGMVPAIRMFTDRI